MGCDETARVEVGVGEMMFEPARDGSVQLGAKASQQAVVCHLLQQAVLEGVLAIACHEGVRQGPDHGALDQLVELAIDRVQDERILEHARPEPPAHDGGVLEHPPRGCPQSVDAGAEKALHGVRHGDVAKIRGRAPPPLFLRDDAPRGHGLQHLLDEERVALGAIHDKAGEGLGQVVLSEHGVDESQRLGRAEARQSDLVGDRLEQPAEKPLLRKRESRDEHDQGRTIQLE